MDMSSDTQLLAASQGRPHKEEKSTDPTKRYRWLFREPREEESPPQVEAASLLEQLDREIKRARKLYLSGETENGMLKYRSAIDQLESIVEDVPPGHSLLQELEDRLSIYEELATKILGPVHVEPKDEISGRVFHLMEKRRICRRNMVLKRAGALRFFDVPDELVTQESAILRKLIEIRATVATAESRRTEEDLRSNLAQVRKALQRSSERYALLRRGMPLSLEDVRKDLLRDNEIMIDFNLLPDRIVMGLITTEKGVYHQIPANRAEIDRAVFNLLDRLKEFSFSEKSSFMGHAWKEPCRRIYRAFFGALPPLPRDKSVAFVIPDRSLWYLPFSALLDAEDRPFGADRLVTLIPSVDMLKVERSSVPGTALSQGGSDLVLFESLPWIAEEHLRAYSREGKTRKRISEGEKIEQLILVNPVYPKATEIVPPVQKVFKKFEIGVGPAATVDRLLQYRGKIQNVTILAVPLAMTDSVRADRQPCFFFSPDKQGRRRFEASRLFADPLVSRLAIIPLAWLDIPDRSSPTGDGPLLLLTAMFYAGIRTGLINYIDPNWGAEDPFMMTALEKAAENGPLSQVLTAYARELPAGLESSFSGTPPSWTGWILMGDPGK
jgi:hypothetical protein